MEPLDPKAELMRLAHLNALAYSAWNDDATAESKADYVHAETALESAITLALAAERRRALEEAAELCDRWAESDWHGALLANQIRALIDGKAGVT